MTSPKRSNRGKINTSKALGNFLFAHTGLLSDRKFPAFDTQRNGEMTAQSVYGDEMDNNQCEICGAFPATGSFPSMILCHLCWRIFGVFTPIKDRVELTPRIPSIDKEEMLERIDAERPDWHTKVYGGVGKDELNDNKRTKEFENLGFWPGWASGIQPDYWDDLRLFVFRRDGFKCRGCWHVFGRNHLVCHHITPKEEGGTDSSRNLVTLCKECHPDGKPIYEEET